MNIDCKELNLYLRAAANLYGHITPKTFFAVYKHYTGIKLVKRDLLAYSESDERATRGYEIYPNAIVKCDIPKEKLEEIAVLQEDRQPYLPDREEFLKWADDDYYERTIITDKFINALKSRGMDEDVAESLTATLYKNVMRDEEFAVDYDLMQDTGCFVNLDDEQIDEFLFTYYIPLSNTVRRFANMGFSAYQFIINTVTA